MAINDYSIKDNVSKKEYGNNVKVNMGATYCIVSCSIHNLSEFVTVVDDMSLKGWAITSGITSDDGMVFQSMSFLPFKNNQSNSN